MCALSSSESDRNSGTWIPTSRGSRIIPASAIGGWMDAKVKRWLPCLVHSFSLKLILLALILLSTPLILYWQFSQAEREQLGLLSNAVGQTNHVLAAMLRSHFEEFASEPSGKMQDALSRAVVGDTRVKILVRLADTERNNFIYVASVPNLPQNYLDRERAE